MMFMMFMTCNDNAHGKVGTEVSIQRYTRLLQYTICVICTIVVTTIDKYRRKDSLSRRDS